VPLVCGGIVPHAPLLSEWVSGREVSSACATTLGSLDAFRAGGRYDLGRADVLVIASPHGRSTGIYATIDGSLEGFGAGLPGLEAPGDEDAAELMAAHSGLPFGAGPVDHGVVVPLLLLVGGPDPDEDGSIETEVLSPLKVPPIVACVQGEDDDPFAFGRAVAQAATQLAKERSVAILASAHTSAGLTPRAPLTELEGARDFDDAILATLGRDAGGLADADAAAWAAQGSCGAGPLTAFGHLFKGSAAEVLSYESPFGVGYLVAGVEPAT
jgi:hypothetical protein